MSPSPWRTPSTTPQSTPSSRARGLDPLSARFREAAATGGEVVALSPIRRRHRAQLQRYAIAAEQIEMAVRNVRVLARGAVRAIDLEAHVPDESVAALRDLAAAVTALAPSLDDPARAERAREHAIAAAGRATLGLERTANLSASVIVGQIRSTATDLLRGLGEDNQQAAEEVRHAAGHRSAELEVEGRSRPWSGYLPGVQVESAGRGALPPNFERSPASETPSSRRSSTGQRTQTLAAEAPPPPWMP